MKKHTIITTLASALVLGIASTAIAEDVVTFNRSNGTKEHYLVPDLTTGQFIDRDMKINKTDGTTLSFDIDNLTSVDFETKDYAATFTRAEESTKLYETIPTVFRMIPQETGDAFGFGFGNISATTPSDLVKGEFGVVFTLSAATVYSGTIDLATQADSYTLRLMYYKSDHTLFDYSNPVSGSIWSYRDAKGRVSFTIDATFEDGSHLTAKQNLVTPVSCNTLEGMMPDQLYNNEVYWYEVNDMAVLRHESVKKVTRSVSSYTGKTTYSIYLDNWGDHMVTLECIEDVFANQGRIKLASAPDGSFRLKYLLNGSPALDLYSPNANDGYIQYKNVTDNGFGVINTFDDGTVEIYFDVNNYYNNYNGEHLGDGKHLVVYYKGEIQK